MDEEEFISKTRRKKLAHDQQALGAALVKLPKEQLARISMPDGLRSAIQDAQRFTKHEAIRRQLQYIGKIMREMDTTPIAEQLSALTTPSRRQTALFHVAERWREEMLADSTAIERFAEEFPTVDLEALRNLVAAAAVERKSSKAPKRYRELFHAINQLVQERKTEE